MKNITSIINSYKGFRVAFITLSLSFLVCSCTTLDPKKVDVELEKTEPVVKITSFTQSLADLGLMTEIYDMPQLALMSKPIGDNTGASGSTGGEIPRDITEMIKSSLNSIGGRIIYIPYDPSFIQNTSITGYSIDGFENKIIPDVVLSGGITEFDRALEVRGGNTDLGGSKELAGIPDFLPTKEVSFKYGGAAKTGLARITLDFNLIDFQTLAGLQKMNAVNTMEVGKAQRGKELAIGLFGITFGRKGTIRKVQGRHDAVRLLVELSMCQIVGRYYGLPYWRLLGNGAMPDELVVSAIKKYYYNLDESTKISVIQDWLFLHGYDVPLSGELDDSKISALQQFGSSYSPVDGNIDVDTFINVYTSIPVDESTLARRNMITDIYQEQAIAMAESNAEPSENYQEEVQVQGNVMPATYEEGVPAAQETVQVESVEEVEVIIVPKKRTIGSIITDEEW
tara:strand:+ start:932 stop:2293 length:1362 start_codon:yes stop_codon:yes gene_type:complete